MKQAQSLVEFQHGVRQLPFWVKFAGGVLLGVLAPVGWVVGFALVVVMNWRTE